jgi:hypothetical protein
MAIAAATQRALKDRPRDLLLFEFQTGHFAQQPAAQRPGAVVFAGDAETSIQKNYARPGTSIGDGRLSWSLSPTVHDVHIPIAVQQKIH